MNKLLLLAATALIASGCVSDSPLFITGVFPMDPKCSGVPENDKTLLGSGNLDLSGGGSYLLIVKLKNDLDGTLDTKADSMTLVSGKHRNTVNIDSMSITYTTAPASIVLDPETVPITLVIAPADFVNVGVNLFGPNASKKIATSLPANGDRLDLRAKIEFRGNIVSGGRLASTPISFPVSIYRSGFTCPAGEQFVRTSTCGRIGGQDSARLCCSGDATCVPP